MGLREDLLEDRQNITSCTIRDILDVLSPEDREALLEAIEKVRTDERPSRAKVYSNQWLADVLTNNGHTISRSTVARHISGECSCGKSV